MSIERKIKQAQERRLKRVKRKILINAVFQGKIRVTIQRSLQQFYAQAIDDTKRITVASCSTLVTKNPEKKSKVLLAFDLGKDFAKQLQEKNIDNVIFDRRSYLFHGRVKAFVEGLREGGIAV